MAEDLVRGKRLLRSENYDVLQIVVPGDDVAVQIKWTGVVAIDIGALRPAIK